MTLYAERLLPHNTEAEEALIGSLLIDGECIARIAPMLQPGDFYRERNQLCYDDAVALSERNSSIDHMTLAGELARTERLELVGGTGLPLPPGGHHPHIRPRRGLRRDRVPHRHHAKAHSGGVQRSPSWATATPTTWRPRSGRPRTPSTRSGTPPNSGTSSPFGKSSTVTCSNSRPWTTSYTAQTSR